MLSHCQVFYTYQCKSSWRNGSMRASRSDQARIKQRREFDTRAYHTIFFPFKNGNKLIKSYLCVKFLSILQCIMRSLSICTFCSSQSGCLVVLNGWGERRYDVSR